MEWMAKLILNYLKEVNRDAPISNEDLQYRANHLTAQINRTSRARRDFRPERKEEKT